MTIEAPAAPAAAAPATPAPATTPAAAPAAAAPAAALAEPAKPAAAAPAAEPRKTILGGEAKPAEPAKDAPAAKPEGAPEKYTDFKLPEGVAASPEMMTKFSEIARKNNLSQSQAQEFVDLQAQNVKAEIDGRLAAFNAQVETWDKETRAHFGADAEKKFAVAARAMEQIGTPELRTLLNDAGLGSHPEVVKFFVKAGEQLLEDQPVDGKRAGGEAASTASLMFPTMAKKS